MGTLGWHPGDGRTHRRRDQGDYSLYPVSAGQGSGQVHSHRGAFRGARGVRQGIDGPGPRPVALIRACEESEKCDAHSQRPPQPGSHAGLPPDGQTLASVAARSNRIHVWNLARGELAAQRISAFQPPSAKDFARSNGWRRQQGCQQTPHIV